MTHRKCSLAKIRDAAADRKPGYLEAVMSAAASVSESYVTLPLDAFAQIRAAYRLRSKSRTGRELKRILARFGITARGSCSCNSRARVMDQQGPEWCEQNIDTIVGWLREEAAKRGLPFLDAAGRLLVKRAIRNARKAAS